MKGLKFTFLVATSLAAFAVSAHTSSDGEKFATTYNKSGAVLRSKATVIVLGKNCSAASPQYGSGKWTWSNGGFEIVLAQKTFGFPRQELEVDNNSGCQDGIDDSDAKDQARAGQLQTFLSSTILFRPGVRDGDTSVGEYVELIQKTSLMDGSHPKAIGWSQGANRHILKLKVMDKIALLTFDQDLSDQSRGKYSYIHPVKIDGEEMDPQMFFVWITYYKGMSN